MSGEAVSDDH